MVTGNATAEGAKRPLTASDVDDIPLALGVQEMAALFGMTTSRFAQLAKQGRWDRFQLKNPIGRRKYSGVLVRAHFRGGK